MHGLCARWCLRSSTHQGLWCTVLLMLLTGSQAVFADASLPSGWIEQRQWVASVQHLGKNFLVHRSRPAWQSREPALSIVDPSGRELRRALEGTDIRSVAVWRNMVVLIRIAGQNYEAVLLDSLLRQVAFTPLPSEITITADQSPRIEARADRSHVLIVAAGIVFVLDPQLRPLRLEPLEQRVFGAALGTQQWLAIFVHDVGGVAYASMVDTLLRRRVAPSVPLATTSRLYPLGKPIAVVSPVDAHHTSQVSLIDASTSSVRTIALPIPAEHITCLSLDGEPHIAAAVEVKGRYHLTIARAEHLPSALENGVELPAEYGIPHQVVALADTVMVTYAGGLVTVVRGRLESADHVAVPQGPLLHVSRRADELLLATRGKTVVLRRSSHPLWWLFQALVRTGPYVLPAILVVVILSLLVVLRRQRRFLEAMLEVPGAGLVFVLDAAGRLLRTNERGARLLRLTAKVPMRRLYRAYMRHHGVAGVQDFMTTALTVRRPVNRKVEVHDDDEQREYMFTAQPLWGTLGRLRAIVITGIDITEALERRRLVNWAQLAHDMQTNLSTIRLNAEHLSDHMSEHDRERVRRILFQTDVLIQRVRDLVSVGRSEELQRSPVHSAEFCTQLRHEFDAAMFPHVNFVMKLRGTMMNVDNLKLSRAVRNAIENAIKSLRGKQGTVEIATWFDRNNVYIRVSDTGVGMDTLTLENMMKPYFTTAKDGSGTGIGTMIMQHVTHMHGGSLRVTSEPGAGTQVVFRIPLNAQAAESSTIS